MYYFETRDRSPDWQCQAFLTWRSPFHPSSCKSDRQSQALSIASAEA
ncbi:MAG: hypothetical protein F6K28_35750 [Microcoleus sp. SIO2G3]|nr:hypothetical protein [Microcoleus sp. SIO2G3]